jgi:hypothetical protein
MSSKRWPPRRREGLHRDYVQNDWYAYGPKIPLGTQSQARRMSSFPRLAWPELGVLAIGDGPYIRRPWRYLWHGTPQLKTPFVSEWGWTSVEKRCTLLI